MEVKPEKSYIVHEQREFSGSIPNTRVIAFKKSYKEPPDILLLKSAKQTEQRMKAQKYVNEHKYYQFVGINEYKNDCTMVRNVMRRRLENRRKDFEDLLDKKRERLACLLNSDSEKYNEEFENLFPSYEEKLNAFITNVNELKKRKSEERNRIASEMYEKRWNKNCDELRSKHSSLTYKACAKDNLKTIQLRNEFRQVDNENNKFLMNLMDKRMEAEDAERELVRQEKVLATKKASVLNQQLAKEKLLVAEEEKKEALQEGLDRFKEFEKEEAAKKEAERLARAEKLKSARKDLKAQLELHEKKKALEKEVEDIMNERFLEERAQFKQREEEKQNTLRHQFTVAKQFAENIKQQEREQERKFEACVKKMMDAATKKTNDLLRKREEDEKIRIMDAKQQCDRLLVHKAMRNANHDKILKMEQEAMEAMTKESNEIAEQNKQYRRQKARAHQSDLIAQIAYNDHLRSLDATEKQRERAKMRAAEEDYYSRIQKALEDATIGNVHPVRIQALGSQGMK